MVVSSTNPPNTCVLYIQESTKFDILEPSLAFAQATALKAGVPFAVIFFLKEAIDNKDELLNFEQSLSRFNIPLIVLIGDREVRTEGLKKHLNPLAILDSQAPVASSEEVKLKPHPYPWPGKVMTIEELSK